MSTPNFYNDPFGLYVADPNDEYANEFLGQADLDCACTEATNELKRKPIFMDITLEPGYYDGVQLRVIPSYLVKEYGTPADQDNDLCQYNFGMCRSVAMRKFESEKKWIKKKLLPTVARCLGFRKLNCVGVFSNGEAVYQWAEK